MHAGVGCCARVLASAGNACSAIAFRGGYVSVLCQPMTKLCGLVENLCRIVATPPISRSAYVNARSLQQLHPRVRILRRSEIAGRPPSDEFDRSENPRLLVECTRLHRSTPTRSVVREDRDDLGAPFYFLSRPIMHQVSRYRCGTRPRLVTKRAAVA